MNWSNLDIYFPTGEAQFNDFDSISIDELRAMKDVNVAVHNVFGMARNMQIFNYNYVYGRDGEEAIAINYDIFDETEHPDPLVRPLNVYGISMLVDFINFYGVDEDEEKDV